MIYHDIKLNGAQNKIELKLESIIISITFKIFIFYYFTIMPKQKWLVTKNEF